jgi:hypothetical protein
MFAPILIPYHAAQSGGLGDLDGLFSNLIKAVAKPFQKIFPAKTVLGKILDPLGVTDPKRNLNLAGRVADVVGTAAAVVAGGWAIGAAAAGTGAGFWATAATGAKVAGAGLLKGAGWLGGGIGTVAKAAVPLLLSGAMGGGAPAAQQIAALQPPSLGFDPSVGTIPGMDMGGAASGGGGGGGTFGTWSQGEGANLPGATVEVTGDTGPNWLVIGAGAVAVFLVVRSMNKKKGR